MIIRPANTTSDVDLMLAWRAEAAGWLAARYGTDQWQNDFPRAELEATARAGETFMVHLNPDGDPVATVTVTDQAAPQLWTAGERSHYAWYVHKLTVSRSAAGLRVGETLLDWAGDRAYRAGQRWLRLDAWTTNRALHEYYLRRGFTHVRTVRTVLSGALFQRPARPVLNGALAAVHEEGTVPCGRG